MSRKCRASGDRIQVLSKHTLFVWTGDSISPERKPLCRCRSAISDRTNIWLLEAWPPCGRSCHRSASIIHPLTRLGHLPSFGTTPTIKGRRVCQPSAFTKATSHLPEEDNWRT